MNNEIESQLLAALRELEAAVAMLRTANPKPDLAAHFARIDSLADKLPKGTDGELLHFLVKKSYQKARLRLEAGAGVAERGACH